MTSISQRKYVLAYFSAHGLVDGRDYTYSGLRTDIAPAKNKLIGIEFFGGFWRTYVAEKREKLIICTGNLFPKLPTF